MIFSRVTSNSCSLRRHSVAVLCLLFTVLIAGGCRTQSESSEDKANDTADLVIGKYSQYRVIDGDTFHIQDLDRGVRFLNIDTEEVPHGKKARQRIDALRSSWPEPYLERRDGNPYPIKMPTPFGWETEQAAKKWFADVDSIRLERDTDSNMYGYFGRWLAYVFARKNGVWVNYNVECVRMGWSPYFAKYGFSTRFHEEFLAAEQEARQAQRGIWNPSVQHYPDYDERLSWWNTRGRAVDEFIGQYADDAGYYFIGRDGEYERLALAAGDTVIVFGATGWTGDDRPVTMLTIPHKEDMAVWVPIPGQVSDAWLREREQQYVYVKGVVAEVEDGLQVTPASTKDISRSPLSLDSAPQ